MQRKEDRNDAAISSAEKIAEEDKKTFVLAGVCVAAHHYLTDAQAERIGGLLKMTKVGQLFERERLKYGVEQKKAGIEEVARNMLLHGDDEEYVKQMTGLTQADIDRILGRTVETVTA